MLIDNIPERERPIFVVGARRSGTTLLGLMLNSHSRISIEYESGFIAGYGKREGEFDLSGPEGVASLLADFSAKPTIRIWDKALPTASEVFAAMTSPNMSGFFCALYGEMARQKGAVRWGDKSPSFVHFIAALDQLFPHAVFIHIIRDCRDVAVSRRNIRWFSHDVEHIAKDWVSCLESGRAGRGRVGDARYLEVIYEELVAQPEEALRWICRFARIEFEPGMLAFHETARTTLPRHDMHVHENTTRPVTPSSVGLWRTELRASHRAIIEHYAGEWLASLGYPVDPGPAKMSYLALLLTRCVGARDRLLGRHW